MLPILAGMAAAGALKAGIGGIQKFAQGEEQEEEAKKNALMQLGNSQVHNPAFRAQAPIPEAPGFGESVIAPMASAAATGAAAGALSDPSGKLAKNADGTEVPWWQQAGRAALRG